MQRRVRDQAYPEAQLPKLHRVFTEGDHTLVETFVPISKLRSHYYYSP